MQETKEETEDLNNTINQVGVNIYRTFHPKTEDTLSSSARGPFSRTSYILGHKTNSQNSKV